MTFYARLIVAAIVTFVVVGIAIVYFVNYGDEGQ